MYVTGTELGSAEGRIVYEPDHPLADADGNVRYPDIDMAEQMGALIMAQRGYQANARSSTAPTKHTTAALQIGRS